MKKEEVRYDGGLMNDEIVREMDEAEVLRETLIFVVLMMLHVRLVLVFESVQVMLAVGVMEVGS